MCDNCDLQLKKFHNRIDAYYIALAKIDLTRKWIFQDYIISTTKRVGTYCSWSTMEPNPFFSRISISIATWETQWSEMENSIRKLKILPVNCREKYLFLYFLKSKTLVICVIQFLKLRLRFQSHKLSKKANPKINKKAKNSWTFQPIM